MANQPESVERDDLVRSPTSKALDSFSIERRLSLLPETGTPSAPGGGPEPTSATRKLHEGSLGPAAIAFETSSNETAVSDNHRQALNEGTEKEAESEDIKK